MHLHLLHAGRGRAPAIVVVLALAFGAVLAACGGSSPGQGVVSLANPSASPDPSASPSASVDPEEAMQAFSDCMRDHGVDVQVAVTTSDGSGGQVGQPGFNVAEDPSGGPAQPGKPLDLEKMKAADEACRPLLPRGGLGGPNATMDPALADGLLKFAQCMRDHGIDFPDPQFSGGGVSIGIGPGGDGGVVDPTSTAFKAAQDACGKDLPGGAPFMVSGSSGSDTAPAP